MEKKKKKTNPKPDGRGKNLTEPEY